MTEFINNMDTPLLRALHYVQCYADKFPDSGANFVAEELLELVQAQPPATRGVSDRLAQAWGICSVCRCYLNQDGDCPNGHEQEPSQ